MTTQFRVLACATNSQPTDAKTDGGVVKARQKSIIETEWWNELIYGIEGPRQGGARIIIDAENAATGAGKTGLAVYLAELLSNRFGYELEAEDMTLSGAHYLQRWREHPDAEQPSVLILDELAGAGAGHSRRGMSQQNVDLGSSWQLMRKKRIVSIVTLPHWRKADKTLRQQADYRLWCREKPIGYFQPYKITTGFDDGRVRTQGYDDIRRIKFPNLDALDDNPFSNLGTKKDDLLDSNTLDADDIETKEEAERDPEVAAREEKLEIAQNLRDNGATLNEIADVVDRSNSWVSKYTESPDKVEDE